MNVKNLFVSFLLLTLFMIFPPQTLAQEKLSGSSATFAAILKTQGEDDRAKVLQAYLDQHNSPLAPYAPAFVQQADYYHIDWRLLPAISGVESTFAHAEPANCYNSWGYGIYGDTVTCFYSYYEAIHTITKALREKYMDKWGATDVYSIGHLYAASPTWANRVSYFMQDIDAFRSQNNTSPLPISL